MKLYELKHSPYCLPVTRIFEAWNVEYESVEVPVWDRSLLAHLTAGNYYQVPVLAAGSELIYETEEDPLAVSHYLDKHFCGGQLFPTAWSGLQDLVIQHIENELEGAGFKLSDIHYIPGITDVAQRTMVIRHKERRFGRGCVASWTRNAEALKQELYALLSFYERRVAQSPFLFGVKPVYADFALYGVCANFTFNGWNSLPPNLPALSAWLERIGGYNVARPSNVEKGLTSQI